MPDQRANPKLHMDMPSQTTDLSVAELDAVARRLMHALEEKPVRPFRSLQYRLGEVGSNRIGPRLLLRALAELTNNRRPRRGKIEHVGPWEPFPGVYVTGKTIPEEAQELAEACQEDIRRLDAYDGQEGLRSLAQAIVSAVGGEIRTGPTPDHAPGQGRDVGPFSGGVLAAAGSVLLWITHELEWLYPDNPYLWQFLLLCAEAEAHPLIVARHIDQTTFALFRVLGARGLQHYAASGPSSSYAEYAALAEGLGWIRVQHPDRFSDHAVIRHAQAAVERLAEHAWAGESHEAVLHAVTWGLPDTNGAASEKLVSWAQGTAVDLPTRWRRIVTRWGEWEQYKPSRRRGRGVARREPKSQPLEKATPVVPSVSTSEPSPGGSAERWTFGRETTIERVPFPIRRW